MSHIYRPYTINITTTIQNSQKNNPGTARAKIARTTPKTKVIAPIVLSFIVSPM